MSSKTYCRRYLMAGLRRCEEGHMFSSRTYGNICPYCNKIVRLNHDMNGEDDDYDGTPYIGDLEVLNPVTGWLVCIDGPNKGRDYKIMSEKNFVGRGDGMDIQILGDNHISKRNHAVIVFDPRKQITLVLPGDSQGLVYINGESIYAPTILAPYDTIELGKSKFIFNPLCGEHFSWDDIDTNDVGGNETPPRVNKQNNNGTGANDHNEPNHMAGNV